MKRECFWIASFLILLLSNYCDLAIGAQVELVDQQSDVIDEGPPAEHPTDEHDDYYMEDQYYEEYEEEVEFETFEYEDIVEFEDDGENEDEEDYDYFYEDHEHDRPEINDNCIDDHEECEMWASVGECDANPIYMRRACPVSCNTCKVVRSDGTLRRGLDVMTYEELIELDTADDSYKIPGCIDRTPNCPRLASQGECESDPEYMKRTCPESCNFCRNSQYHIRGADLGVPQSLFVDGFTKRYDITWMIGKARNYMIHYAAEEEDPDVLSWCHNEHRLCSFWALLGECENNQSYMKYHCGPACNSCAWHEYHERCPRDPDAKAAWKSGDLNKMFESIVADKEYEVEVLSSPETDGPWVITIDNLLTEEEAKRLIQLGHDAGYERSELVSDVDDDDDFGSEISDDRTSTNAWCTSEECADDEVTERVLERIETLTGIPADNGEYMQLLKYEPGQFYRPHHDFIEEQEYRMQGVRILTVFLYLNEVEGGGATYFDLLDLKVEPKVGKALIWPSTLDFDPDEMDPRTRHEAQKVTKGVKYAANVWYHQYSFKGAERIGCLD